MFKLKHLAVTLTLLVGVNSEFVVLERRDSPPPGFSPLGPPAEDDILTLRLALPSRSIPDLHNVVYEISTPGNICYGQYLTQDEIAQFVAPTTNTVSRVTSWLSSNNLTATRISPAGEWIAVNMTVSQANALLAADFSTFQKDGANQTVVRTLSYSIPSALKTSIDWVHPTTRFISESAFVNKTSTPTSARGPTSSMSISHDCRIKSSWTPRCLQELYGIPSTAAKQTANVFGVSGFFDGFANKRDLQVSHYALTPNIFLVMSVDSGINNQLPAGAGLFVAQDIQYAIGLTTGVPVTSFPQAHNRVVGSSELPVVIGTSASNRTQQLSNAYAQLAARGVSYIIQTGIFVAGGVPFQPDCTLFDPPFPVSCPFVTAVGATEFNNHEAQETASELSGGGFSKCFSPPDIRTPQFRRNPKRQRTPITSSLMCLAEQVCLNESFNCFDLR
ncbi:Pro-kumamolisin, activation domain-containing protein [Mycena leptocephala]|nr:Pro-kumamolisin, activation domain-containing protein [Mycena leptocephala]